jgi:hypothetical protein
MRCRRLGLLLGVGYLSSALALAATAMAQEVEVQRFANPSPGTIGLRGEVRYSLARGDIRASLSYEPTSATLILRVQGGPTPTSMAVQGELLVPLLARFLADYPDTRRVTVLLTDHAEIAARLGTVLAACVNWDGKTGRPVHGSLVQFLVDTVNRHDLASEVAKVFADQGYSFMAQGASMVTEGRVAAANNKVVPIDITYLGFIAVRSSEHQGETTWPTQSHHSTC